MNSPIVGLDTEFTGKFTKLSETTHGVAIL